MICTFGCLHVTTDGDDEAVLNHGTVLYWVSGKTAANESPPTSCARALHMRFITWDLIDPVYEPIRLTDLN